MKLAAYGESFHPGSDRLLIFLHIYKCGGTTLSHILERHFQVGRIPVLNDLEWLKVHHWQKKINTFTFISGHGTWGIHELFPKHTKAYYITLLRDPWRRFVSEYKFHLQLLETDLSFKEYLLNRKTNFLISALGGGDYNLAQKRLLQDFFIFGILEYWDLFMKMVAQAFGLRELSLEIHNATKANDKLSSYNDCYQLFVERHQLDIKFYHWARELFLERTATLKSNYIHPKKQMKNSKAVHSAPNALDDNYLEKLKQKKHLSIVESQILARHAEKNNDLAQAELRYKNAFLRLRGGNLIKFYYKTRQKAKLRSVIETLLPELQRLPSSLPDSYLRQKIHYYQKIKQQLKRKNIPLDPETQVFVQKTLKWIEWQGGSLNSLPAASKIIFYGASGRFISTYPRLKPLLPAHCQLFLADSNQDKWGKTLLGLKIQSPQEISTIKPDLAIITSCYFEDIYTTLSEIRTKNNLSFQIFAAQPYGSFLVWTDDLEKVQFPD